MVATQNGKLPTSRNIQTSFDRILKKAGLPHYGTHALRHTFATRLLRKTQSHQEIKAVAELLGDDYHVVVKTYLHTEEE
ncbi:tyrosine-type recombinase/integrase, partial [Streptococcus salivarius]|uniref:tyrosine-type recombinase/integrase n=1 Tax=Streptococcus salivarius TaxID=1304 RepID=UPI001D06B220